MAQGQHFLNGLQNVREDLQKTQGSLQLRLQEQAEKFLAKFEDVIDDIDSQNDKLRLNFHDVREDIRGSVFELSSTFEQGTFRKQRQQLASQRELFDAVQHLQENVQKHGLVAAILPIVVTIGLFGKLKCKYYIFGDY
jgi:uncharacterized protein YoxC